MTHKAAHRCLEVVFEHRVVVYMLKYFQIFYQYRPEEPDHLPGVVSFRAGWRYDLKLIIKDLFHITFNFFHVFFLHEESQKF